MVSTPAPTAGLVFPKTESKPPFQTREQIERQIARGGKSAIEPASIWECLLRRRYRHLVPAVSQAALLSVFGATGITD